MCYSSGSPLRLPMVSSEAVLGAERGLSVKVRFDRCAFPTRSLPRRASLCPGRISDSTFLPPPPAAILSSSGTGPLRLSAGPGGAGRGSADAPGPLSCLITPFRIPWQSARPLWVYSGASHWSREHSCGAKLKGTAVAAALCCKTRPGGTSVSTL